MDNNEDYYVIYDYRDNIICLCVGLKELAHCISRDVRRLRYQFKNKDVIYYFYTDIKKNTTMRRICKFTDNSDLDVFCNRTQRNHYV